MGPDQAAVRNLGLHPELLRGWQGLSTSDTVTGPPRCAAAGSWEPGTGGCQRHRAQCESLQERGFTCMLRNQCQALAGAVQRLGKEIPIGGNRCCLCTCFSLESASWGAAVNTAGKLGSRYWLVCQLCVLESH